MLHASKSSLAFFACLTSLGGCTNSYVPSTSDDSTYALDASDAAVPEGDADMQGAIAANPDACDPLEQLAALDGTIELLPDGSAEVHVSLVNISDEDFLRYPGLRATWWLAHSYQEPKSSSFAQLYGLLARDRYDAWFTIPASDINPLGHFLVVTIDPTTLEHWEGDPSCVPAGRLELSAEIPSR
jgi:hypothetical protein